MSTGSNTPGMLAEATTTSRNSLRAGSPPRMAMAPKSQITVSSLSRSVVATHKSRPVPASRATARMRSAVTYWSTSAARAALRRLVPSGNARSPRTLICAPRPPVKASVSCESQSEPKNANGAMSAPVLTPVTTSYRGRAWRRESPTKAPAPNAPPAPPPERTSARSVPSLDKVLSRCRAAVDFAWTLARSVLRNRTSAGKSTGVAALKIVGGASRRGRAHPTSAKTPSTHVPRSALTCQQRWSLFRIVSILRFLRVQLPTNSMPDRGRIDRTSCLGRKHDRYRGGEEDHGDYHHQAVGRQRQALARHKIIEHLVDHLSGRARGKRGGQLAAGIDDVRELGVCNDRAVLPGGRDQRGGDGTRDRAHEVHQTRRRGGLFLPD